MYFVNHFVIDWDKVQTIDDIKRILQVVCPAFEFDTPGLNTIQDLGSSQPKPQGVTTVYD